MLVLASTLFKRTLSGVLQESGWWSGVDRLAGAMEWRSEPSA